jgi:hypothetical protein
VYILDGKEVRAIEVKRKVSLCPECTACHEVEILEENGRPVAVRIGDGEQAVTLPKSAWNTLVRYVREMVLKAL